ncbi:hypothetical protein O181_002115 [Austropuccinia psidii MF-1]|uniref:Protein YIP n=1 Tax=Austropuccinia psidii MF-1 TaxID=1389203 RepID=A0A9Q3GCI3_9BASI|nr:hypothetical protein [Austropuccinia psidii MF-1]
MNIEQSQSLIEKIVENSFPELISKFKDQIKTRMTETAIQINLFRGHILNGLAMKAGSKLHRNTEILAVLTHNSPNPQAVWLCARGAPAHHPTRPALAYRSCPRYSSNYSCKVSAQSSLQAQVELDPMANPYSAVTVFDADESSKATVAADSLAFQDFSASVPPDHSSADGADQSHSQGKIRQSVYDPEVELQRRLGGSQGWLSLDAYSPYFDVETKTVLERCWRTMYPKEDYVEVVLAGQPDLYGPFWLPTTLIFILFFASSLSGALAAYLNSQSYDYDFSKLSLAVGLVYVYALVLPACMWAAMRYWAGVEGRTIPEIINLYGYGLTVFVPISILSIPPFPLLRGVLALAAFAMSLTFLIRNLYPVLAAAPAKTARILLLAVLGLHGVFTLVLWFGYLSIGGTFEKVIAASGPSNP